MGWKKGQSGNPAGSKPQTMTVLRVTDIAKEHGPEALAKLIEIMRTSERESVAMRAAELILDRGFGRTVQAVEAKIEHVTAENRRQELAGMFDSLAERLRAPSVAGESEPS